MRVTVPHFSAFNIKYPAQDKYLVQKSNTCHTDIVFTGAIIIAEIERARIETEKARKFYIELPAAIKMIYPAPDAQKIGVKFITREEAEINADSLLKSTLGDDLARIMDKSLIGCKFRDKYNEQFRKDFDNYIKSFLTTNNPDYSNSIKLLESCCNKHCKGTGIKFNDFMFSIKTLKDLGDKEEDIVKVIDGYKKFSDYFIKKSEQFNFMNASHISPSNYLSNNQKQILFTIATLDTDVLMELFTQREEKFTKFIQNMSLIYNPFYEDIKTKKLAILLHKAIQLRDNNGNKLYPQDKIKITQNTFAYIDLKKIKNAEALLESMIKKGCFNLDEYSKNLIKDTADVMDLNKVEYEKFITYKFKSWDSHYFSLLVSTLVNSPKDKAKIIKDLIKTTINNNYSDYIFDRKTEIGLTNLITKQIFAKNNLDFDTWLNYDKEESIDLSQTNSDTNNVKIRIIKRKPEHDLFLGDYAKCCAGLKGLGEKSFAPIETLINTSVQVAEIVDNKDKTVGKVSMYFAKDIETNEKFLAINSIQGNNSINHLFEDEKFKKKLDDFAKIYAVSVSKDKNIKVLYPSSEGKNINIEFIGKTYKNRYFLQSIQWGSHINDMNRVHEVRMKQIA